MFHHRKGYRGHKIPHSFWIGLAIIIALTIGGFTLARHNYEQELLPVTSSQKTVIFTVPRGSSVQSIAEKLQAAKLIRSAWAFQVYVQRHNLSDTLKAGTYALSPSQGTARIVTIMTRGETAKRLVTILPGRRIDQVRADLINEGFTPEAVDRALDPANYGDMSVLALKPADVHTLEGLLWPDSYDRPTNADPEVVIRQSLAAMAEHLTAEVQAAFTARGLSVYQGLILTSMVDQEVSRPADQAQVAQVFLLRLQRGMMLGSDSSTKYGAVAVGRAPDLTYDSPYNTLKRHGLPPTPISTVSQSSLYAATHPASTDWLYFVSGDDGATHFSHTAAEHEALTAKYCHQLCGN